MPIVTVNVRNTNYPIVCDSGQEELLQSLAKKLDRRISSLSESQGKGSDIRLLVMAALMMESEIQDLKEKLTNSSDITTTPSMPLASGGSFDRDIKLCQEINNITIHLETIASELDQV